MSHDDLRQFVLDTIENRLSDLFSLSVALQRKYPELGPIAQGVGAQPCNTEFTTVGEGGNQGLTVAGFTAAYQEAQNFAQTVCNTGTCKTLTFIRYVEVTKTPTKQWRLTIAWKCV
jgi:hypothetical protein